MKFSGRSSAGTPVLALAVALIAPAPGCDGDKASTPKQESAAADKKADAVKPLSAATPHPASKEDRPANPSVAAANKPIEPAEAQPAGVTQASLDHFIPDELAGLKRFDTAQAMSVTEGALIAHGAYLIEHKGDRRFVNVNISEVVDLEFEKAQLVVGEGETKGDGSASGKTIDGRLVQRRSYATPAKSEATVLLADRIVVTVSVEKATTPDEAIGYLTALDLAGLEGLVQ